jgi:hypothetical protein
MELSEVQNNIIPDILNILLDYICTPKYKLLDWIDISKLDWFWISYNTRAISLLEKNLDKIGWSTLSGNPEDIHILEKIQIK